ncbi:MAG: hypothetical protein HUU50_12530 [Candidatus Brocadiae bacterium]|nr:hypothetical protein [Candidatus Brocadiia bacterium]
MEDFHEEEEKKTQGEMPEKHKKFPLFLVLVASQVLSLIGLLYFFMPSKQTENKPISMASSSALLWEIWEKLGDEALQNGHIEESIYFFEKIYKDLPAESSKKIPMEKKLAKAYYQYRKSKTEDPKSASLENMPEKYSLAESAYQKGEYQKAYCLFYEYLLQSDEKRQYSSFSSKAQLRTQQCQLQIFLAQLPIEKEELNEEILKIIKK